VAVPAAGVVALPNKVMADIGGQPMLPGRVLERCRQFPNGRQRWCPAPTA